MQHLMPQEMQAIPEPAGPAASLIYIGLQPIDEGTIGVGITDEDTDGCISHDQLFTAHFNLVSWQIPFAKARTSSLTSERYHMCVCGVNAQSGSSFQGVFNSLLRYMVHRMPGLCTIFTDPWYAGDAITLGSIIVANMLERKEMSHMNNRLPIQHSKRILGVFAHPDDESFCAGGTFAKYAATGAEVMVVSATRGEAGQIRMPSVATRRTLGAVREQELHLACQRLGIQHAARCLDHMDGTLKDFDQEVLTRKITEIIRTFRPDVVITFGPDGGYGHPDHIAISAATAAACMRSGEPGRFPEHIAAGLEAHQLARLYYSYFPPKRQLLLEQLVQWLVQVEKGFRGTLDFAYALLLLCEAADGTLQFRAQLKPGDFFGEEGLAHKKPAMRTWWQPRM
jgi:LmbE family N-acetylglucosaminyl deacetylase